MPDDKLAPAPKVSSLAQTNSSNLIAARNAVQRNPEIQRAFGQAAAEKWSGEELADRLALLLGGDIEGEPDEVYQTALYLSDEYLQMGDSVLLISPETGKAIARVTENDIWQPPDVPREGGGMAKRQPRLDPKLEGFLVQWEFEKGREAAQVAALAARLNQTPMLKEGGDRRLLVASRRGRKHIVDELRDALPDLLPSGCNGASARFLDRLEFVTDPSPELDPVIQCVGYARASMPIADMRAVNLRHDHFTSLKAKVATSWAREVAHSLALAAHTKLSVEEWDFDSWPGSESYRKPGYGYWVAEPNTAHALVSEVFPVPGAPTICLRTKAGAVVVDPDSFECDGRERADRWDVLATFKYTLYMDWDRVLAFNLTGIPISGASIA